LFLKAFILDIAFFYLKIWPVLKNFWQLLKLQSLTEILCLLFQGWTHPNQPCLTIVIPYLVILKVILFTFARFEFEAQKSKLNQNKFRRYDYFFCLFIYQRRMTFVKFKGQDKKEKQVSSKSEWGQK